MYVGEYLMKKLLALVLCLLLTAGFVVPLAGASTSVGGDVVLTNSGSITETPKIRQYETWAGGTIGIQAMEGVAIQSAEIVTSTDLAKFPFDVTQLSYVLSANVSLPAAAGQKVLFTIPAMRVRGDAAQNYYDIPILVRFTKGGTADEETLTFRVIVIEAASSGTGSTVAYTPKVIVTGFTTNPAEVVAGEDFTLSVTFKNTSDSGTVNNLKAALSSADNTFNPVSGSSTLFISSLAPGASKSVSIKLHAKAEAAPGSYNISFALNYDAPGTKDNAPVTDTEVVAVPIKQVPKVQVTQLQLQPSDMAYIGNDVNVMSTVNNTGKSKIYNVSVTVTDSANCFAKGEQYLGNLDSGATGNVDLYINAQQMGTGKLTMKVTYEDEEGKSYSTELTGELAVVEKTTTDPAVVEPTEPTKTGPSWWLWVILALIAGGVTAAILISRRKKAVRRERDRLAAKQLEEQYVAEQSSGK